MKKIVSMTNTVDNNKKSLRINYLCPTGAIPVFYDFSTTKKKNKRKDIEIIFGKGLMIYLQAYPRCDEVRFLYLMATM